MQINTTIFAVTRPVCIQDSLPDSTLPIKYKYFNILLTPTPLIPGTRGSAIALPVHSYRQVRNVRAFTTVPQTLFLRKESEFLILHIQEA